MKVCLVVTIRVFLITLAETRAFNGKSVDIWALGATLYCLLHGRCPFEDVNIVSLYDKILKDDIQYSPDLTVEARDLLERMLCRDPSQRIKLDEIKTHNWTTMYGIWPMISTEENCTHEDVTEEDVKNAFKPAVMFINKVMNRLLRKKSWRQSGGFNLASTKQRYSETNLRLDEPQLSQEICSESTLIYSSNGHSRVSLSKKLDQLSEQSIFKSMEQVKITHSSSESNMNSHMSPLTAQSSLVDLKAPPTTRYRSYSLFRFPTMQIINESTEHN